MSTTYTKIAKPSGTSFTAVPKAAFSSVVTGMAGGIPIGLLMAITYTDSQTTVVTDPWTDVAKPSGTSFTKIAKAT